MNVYRTPPEPLPSLRDFEAEARADAIARPDIGEPYWSRELFETLMSIAHCSLEGEARARAASHPTPPLPPNAITNARGRLAYMRPLATPLPSYPLRMVLE